jgi:elongation factor Ts
MAITAQQVKALRDKTGAGMMDCKKALAETGGDEEQALVWLREKGLAKAQKRAGRAASDGLIGEEIRDGVGVLVEVRCETDFVARSDKFQDFTAKLAAAVAEGNPASVDELLDLKLDGVSVADAMNELVAVLGEKIETGEFVRFEKNEHGAFGSYIHTNGKIGVLVDFVTEADTSSPEFQEMAKDVAMQVAALSPLCVDSEGIPEDVLEREKAIYKKQAMDEGKPENIAEKIVQGRLGKFYKEACLVDQPFIKDDKKSVRDRLRDFSGDVSVKRFVRLEVGAGVEEEEEE